jgi:hypothetical protein
MDKVKLTDHAKLRRKQMGVTEHQIEAAIADPDTVYPGGRGHPKGRTCFQRGPIVVVTEGHRVVTILWHRMEGR